MGGGGGVGMAGDKRLKFLSITNHASPHLHLRFVLQSFFTIWRRMDRTATSSVKRSICGAWTSTPSRQAMRSASSSRSDTSANPVDSTSILATLTTGWRNCVVA